jgi:hypothetical protein
VLHTGASENDLVKLMHKYAMLQKLALHTCALTATFKRSSRNYQTVYDLSVEDYEKLFATRISAELQKIRDSLKEIQRTSQNFSKELRPFSFIEFEKGSFQKILSLKNVKFTASKYLAERMSLTSHPLKKNFLFLEKINQNRMLFQQFIFPV